MRSALPTMGLVVLAACEAESQARTQVVVLVGGAPEVRMLDLHVYDEDGGVPSDSLSIDFTRRAPGRLPTSFTIEQPAHGAARFRLVVQGYEKDAAGGSKLHARTELVATFTRGATTVLPVVLSTLCATEHCGCNEGKSCDATCRSSDHTCVEVPRYGELPPIEPGEELDIDQGVEGCDAGSFPDATGRCQDFDECAFSTDQCDPTGICVNLTPAEGRYECTCPEGYAGTGYLDDPCSPCDAGAACEAEAEFP